MCCFMNTNSFRKLNNSNLMYDFKVIASFRTNDIQANMIIAFVIFGIHDGERHFRLSRNSIIPRNGK